MKSGKRVHLGERSFILKVLTRSHTPAEAVLPFIAVSTRHGQLVKEQSRRAIQGRTGTQITTLSISYYSMRAAQ